MAYVKSGNAKSKRYQAVKKRRTLSLASERARMNKALEQLRKGMSIQAACRSIALSRKTFYIWVNRNADFKEAVESAIEDGTDTLEDVAVKRAKKSSDMLLMFMLNGRRPEKYKRKVEHSGDSKRPIIIRADLPGDERL